MPLSRHALLAAAGATAVLTGTSLAAGGAVEAPSAPSPQPTSAAPAAQLTPSDANLRQQLARAREQATVVTRTGRPGPVGPNPWLAQPLPGQRQDWTGWREELQRAANDKATARTRAGAKVRAGAQPATGASGRAIAVAPPTVREREPDGARGRNDSFRTAQPLVIGTRPGQGSALRIQGRLSPAAPPKLVDQPRSKEEDGTVRTARDTGIPSLRNGFRTTGTIGDGTLDPIDYDLYKVTLSPGQLLSVQARRTSGNLKPFTVLVGPDGRSAEHSSPEENDESLTRLTYTPRVGGTYILGISGVTVVGDGKATDTTGDYAIEMSVRAGDRDLYRVDLRAGDVLGASVDEAATFMSVFDGSGVEVHGSDVNNTFVYPMDSPLPGAGKVATEHVVARTGTYYVEVTAGDGAYSADVEVYRHGGAAARRTQTIYLDTDGQRLNTGPLSGRGASTLSPLRSFLAKWGIPARQEKALVAHIKATVQENLIHDLKRSGLSSTVDVKVVTSTDGADPFGRPGVSRVVLGGTIAETGLYTIGIAQSIDPGNFDREETAVVLLDTLSGPTSEKSAASLNTYMRAHSNRVAFVGRALGNVVSHEVGHMIGNWHTDNTNSKTDLMDAGGEGYARLFGVGRDRVGGTRDDVDTDFGHDRFHPAEGFTGLEDTLARSTWGTSRAGR